VSLLSFVVDTDDFAKQSQVAPTFIVLLVEIITSSIDAITSPSSPASYLPPSQQIEGMASLDMIKRYVRNTVEYSLEEDIAESGVGSTHTKTANKCWNVCNVVADRTFGDGRNRHGSNIL
jgi:hypothetical protein